MNWLDKFIGRLGLGVNEQGERVRTRPHASDDWGNTTDHVEVKDPVTGKWVRGENVPGSGTGGHY